MSPMDAIYGFAIIMVVGVGSLSAFAIYMTKREERHLPHTGNTPTT